MIFRRADAPARAGVPARRCAAAELPRQRHPAKNVGTAYKLFFWLGIFGAHRFYQGKIGTGILWLLTGRLLGIGNIVDSFTLDTQILRTNQKNGLAPSGR